MTDILTGRGMGNDIMDRNDEARTAYLQKLTKIAVRVIKTSIVLAVAINIAAFVLALKSAITPTSCAIIINAVSCFIVLAAMIIRDKKKSR